MQSWKFIFLLPAFSEVGGEILFRLRILNFFFFVFLLAIRNLHLFELICWLWSPLLLSVAWHETLPQWEAPLFSLIYIYIYMIVMMMMEKLVEWMILTEETEVLGENLHRRHFVHHKSHLPDPGRRGGKPATNRFSYGAACILNCVWILVPTVEGKGPPCSGCVWSFVTKVLVGVVLPHFVW
jgi:hypothetical protein